jgi:opacity protein-like surface antigen
MSTSGFIKDVTMPLFGQRLAEQQFPQANEPLDANGRGTLTQSFKTTDLSLKNSLMYGGKIGYFFTDERLPWLGVELEAFTSNPTIKTQSVATEHDITFQPNTPDTASNCSLPIPPNPQLCPAFSRTKSSLSVQQSDVRVVTVAFNVIARYRGEMFQPYVGVGAGAFYFHSSSGTIQGRQWAPGLNALAGLKFLVTDEWGLFAEGKYNMANISNFDPTFGLSGMYSIFHFVGGIAYHF